MIAKVAAMPITYYDILEVSSSASQTVISAAYRTLSQKYHPDKNNGDKHCEEMMAQINVAFGVLSDPIKRKVYDEELALNKAKNNSSQNKSTPTQKEQYTYQPHQPKVETVIESNKNFSAYISLAIIGAIVFLLIYISNKSQEEYVNKLVQESQATENKKNWKWQSAENFLTGKGSSQNYIKALQEYEEIYNEKLFYDGRAEKRIAEIYFFGLGQERNYTKALEWYKKVYGSESEYMIGYMYYEGLGVKKDLITAYHYFNKAQTDSIELSHDYQFNPLIQEQQNKLIEANIANGEVKIDYYGSVLGRYKVAARIKKNYLDKKLSVDEINKAQNLKIVD